MPRNYARHSIEGLRLRGRRPDALPPLHLFLLPIGCPSYDHTAHAPTIHPCSRTGPVVWCSMLQQSERASHSKGLQPMQPPFTPAAHILWGAIPPHFQERILYNVCFPHCSDMTSMTYFCKGSIRQEFGLRGDVCDLSREGCTCVGRSPCDGRPTTWVKVTVLYSIGPACCHGPYSC
jgi:hypothetical protein